MSFYETQCGLSDAVKDLFYDQLHVRAVTTVIHAWEFLIPCGDRNVQAQVTKKYMEAVGMAGQTLILRVRRTRPRGYKTFFVLNSIEREISTAHKNKIPTNGEVSCYKLYHASKCLNAYE